MAVKELLASGVLFDERRKFYIKPQTYAELYPSATPFLSGLQAKGPRQTRELDYKLFEHRAGWINMRFIFNDATPESFATGAPGETLSAVEVSNATNVTFDSSLVGATCEVWDTTDATYKGQVRVTAVNGAGPDIDIVSLGNEESETFLVSAFADQDIFKVISFAGEELRVAAEADSTELTVVYNSLQHIETSLELTGDLARSDLRGAANERARLRKDKANTQKIKVENALWRGMRTSGIGGATQWGTDATFVNHVAGEANATQVRTTMGWIPIMRRYGVTSGASQNVFSLTKATTTVENWNATLEKIFQYNPTGESKIAYCGPGAITYFADKTAPGQSGWTLNHNVESSVIKTGVSRLETPHGSFTLVKAPLMTGPYNDYVAIVDPGNVDLMQGEPDSYMTNIKKEDGYTGIKDVFRSHVGLGLTLVERHALVKLT